MPEDHFGPEVARHYDETSAGMFAPEVLDPAVAALAALARGGPALEFAIGTGRVGLPLAARGVPVTGIELSEAMVAQLRAKPGGADLPVTIGDMATTRVEGEFSLVYLVFNSLVNLTSQAAQVDCFGNAAAHLAPGGRFVVEVGVPQIHRMAVGERVHAFAVRDDYAGIDSYDVATQQMASHHFHDDSGDGRYRRATIPFRYVWPSELDLMARIAGLELESRAGDWAGGAFTTESTSHVSVWVKPPRADQR